MEATGSKENERVLSETFAVKWSICRVTLRERAINLLFTEQQLDSTRSSSENNSSSNNSKRRSRGEKSQDRECEEFKGKQLSKFVECASVLRCDSAS